MPTRMVELTVHPLVDFLPLRRAFNASRSRTESQSNLQTQFASPCKTSIVRFEKKKVKKKTLQIRLLLEIKSQGIGFGK